VFEIAENDMDANIIKKAKSYIQSYVNMSDGTRYEAIVLNGTVKGLKYDQIILVDDNRWMIYNKYYDEINELKYYCLSPLFDGLDAQIIKYEW
jgi:beta-xylosidase